MVTVDRKTYDEYHAARRKLAQCHASNRLLARKVLAMHVRLFYRPEPRTGDTIRVCHPLLTPITARARELYRHPVMLDTQDGRAGNHPDFSGKFFSLGDPAREASR